jgi:hypothetical protein
MIFQVGVRLIVGLLALFVTFGACTPEAIVVDPPGAAGDDTGSGATSTTGAASGDGAGEGGTSSSLPNGGEPDSGGGMPQGGKAGGAAAGNAGSAGKGGSAGSGNCAALSAPKPACTTCIPAQCAAEAKACEGTTCTCGDYGGYNGQMNCLLACPTLSPMMAAAADCASKCGFDNLGPPDSPLHQLFDCLVNPPMGPPLCPDCFPVH